MIEFQQEFLISSKLEKMMNDGVRLEVSENGVGVGLFSFGLTAKNSNGDGDGAESLHLARQCEHFISLETRAILISSALYCRNIWRWRQGQ